MTSTASTRRGATVAFSLDRTLNLEPETAWRMLADWDGHADWIPMTRVKVDETDPTRFTAWSGLGPLALEDRMHAVESEFDGSSGRCLVEKLGPVLVGEAEFTVRPGPTPGTATVGWREEVGVPHLPRFLAPVAGALGRVLFGRSLRRMERFAQR
jgi:hypothetical protein